MENEEEQQEAIIQFKEKEISESAYQIHLYEEKEKNLQKKLRFVLNEGDDTELEDMYNKDIIECVSKRTLLNQYVDETLASISILNSRLNTYYKNFNTQTDVDTYMEEQKLDTEIERKAEEMELQKYWYLLDNRMDDEALKTQQSQDEQFSSPDWYPT